MRSFMPSDELPKKDQHFPGEDSKELREHATRRSLSGGIRVGARS